MDTVDTLQIRLADYPQDFPAIAQVREQVFQQEQGVDPSLEFDEFDAQAQHFVALWQQTAVGTARIRWIAPQTAKLERLAVLAEYRRHGIGRQLMEYILKFLEQAQAIAVTMHAQTHAIPFYEKLGFVPEGELFAEAGIPHITMSKQLRSRS